MPDPTTELALFLAVPVAATEQHGPHLPSTTDTDIAVALVARLPAAVAAPPLCYGSSGEHAGFAGTLSIGQEATQRVLIELGRSACDSYAHVLFVSTHGGNAAPVARAVEYLRFEGRDVRAWSPRFGGDAHAGRTETSLMLALHPEKVAMSLAEPGCTEDLGALMPRLRRFGVRAVSPNGVLGDPTGASAAEGRELLRRAVEDLRAFVADWLRAEVAGVSGDGSPRDALGAIAEGAILPGRGDRGGATPTRLSARRRLAPRAQPRRTPDGPGGKRVAIVTGAGRGIGAATVRELVRAGWSVVAVDRAAPDPRVPYALATGDELRSLARERVELLEGDAAQEVVLREAVAVADRRFGGVDAFVAAAGVIAGGVPLWEMPAEQVEAVVEVDLLGVIAGARVAIPAMLRRPAPRDGRFIAVASAAAARGLPRLSAYCAAKAGVVGLVRGLAADLRGTGVTANAVSPGSTRTAMLDETARLYELDSAEAFAAQAQIERLLEPEEIACLIAWLAGPAGRGATGAEFPLDGGMTV